VFIQPYMSGTSFLCELRASVRSFPLSLHRLFSAKSCGWLSQPLSTMPDKTPQRHIAALRRPTWFEDYPRQEHNGASRVLRRISSCMPRPVDSDGPPPPCHIGGFVLPSCYLKHSASATIRFRSCTSTSGSATSPTAYRILCLRLAHLVRNLTAAPPWTQGSIRVGGYPL